MVKAVQILKSSQVTEPVFLLQWFKSTIKICVKSRYEKDKDILNIIFEVRISVPTTLWSLEKIKWIQNI